MTHSLIPIRPAQSIMYVPLQVNGFQKSVLLIVQYKYLKSSSGDLFILQNLILRTRSCGTGFITQFIWFFHFHLTTLAMRKCFVPQLYQFRRGISGGPALKYFYMIHRGRRSLRIQGNDLRWGKLPGSTQGSLVTPGALRSGRKPCKRMRDTHSTCP